MVEKKKKKSRKFILFTEFTLMLPLWTRIESKCIYAKKNMMHFMSQSSFFLYFAKDIFFPNQGINYQIDIHSGFQSLSITDSSKWMKSGCLKNCNTLFEKLGFTDQNLKILHTCIDLIVICITLEI